ncbi:hypothetical protein [Kribbella jejuensis]|uniref:Uncharacterized protein n=1 Tax=Kribbella jejuensis TaxID=236068 RepID=A0A542ESY7_9ACTN|nr:hypothetical protein [Kribbella jejuensis]TQJ18462.1 hypothetical protein FB475_2598 [Kribbella jejuensis]
MTEKAKSTGPTSIRGGGYPASNTPASDLKPPPPGMVSKETVPQPQPQPQKEQK